MLRASRRYILLALALVALGWFFYRFRNAIGIAGFRWPLIGQSLRHARIELLILATAAIYICFAIRALRWMHFSRALGASHFWRVYSATLMGFSAAFLLGRAGEPIRPVLIGKKDALPVSGMFGVYILERAFDMASTAVLAVCALFLFAHGAGKPGSSYVGRRLAGRASVLVLHTHTAALGLATGLGAMAVFLVYFRFRGGAWLAARLQHPRWRSGWRAKIAALLEGFSDGLRGIRTVADLAAVSGYTAIHWILVVLVYYWTAHAFGAPLAAITIPSALLVLAFTMLGSAVQLPGVGGGAQLASFLVFTVVLGVEKEPAAVVSIMLWLVGFASCCLAGLPLLFREGWTMASLRRMARDEEQSSEAVLLEEARACGANSPSPQVRGKEGPRP